MIRARWLIENSVFNNLKNHCSMNHCFVHGGKATEAILYLVFIASNIIVCCRIEIPNIAEANWTKLHGEILHFCR